MFHPCIPCIFVDVYFASEMSLDSSLSGVDVLTCRVLTFPITSSLEQPFDPTEIIPRLLHSTGLNDYKCVPIYDLVSSLLR